jgi:hypothetical protein
MHTCAAHKTRYKQNKMKTLTWAETLHPEEAEAFIDPLNQGENRGSPWTTVYYEARSDIPVAVAERVEEEVPQKVENEVMVSPYPEATTFENEISENKDRNYGRCMTVLLGGTMALVAVISAFAIELVAAIIYCLAVGFHHLAPAGEVAICLRAIILLIVQILMVTDAILLTSNVLLTEVLGVTCWLLCAIFGGCEVGAAWHQYIRKICHLTRWAFRGFHEGMQPVRVFPIELVVETTEPPHHREATAPPPAGTDVEFGQSRKREDVVVVDDVVIVETLGAKFTVEDLDTK